MRGFAGLLREERAFDDSGSPWFVGTKPGQVHVDQSTALKLSAVWACQTLIADAIATLPVDTYRKQGEGRVPTTPAAWVEKPNKQTLRVDFETQRLMSLLGWGNAYAVLSRRDKSHDPQDPVVERWIIPPDSVQMQADRNGNVGYLVDGVPVAADNMQHIRGYLRPGSLLGMSVIEYARRSMGIGIAGDDFGERFFTNGVTPAGVLEVPALPADASKSVVDRLAETFSERYAGTGNARKPMVLTGGTRWSQITIDPKDAQMLETREFQIEEICRFYRVPLHEVQRITGNASQGGGQGMEAQSLMFAQRTLLPWTVRLEQADSLLLPRGQYLRYNLNAFVRADIKTRHEVYQIRRNIGMSNADELRALEDELPIADGAGEGYWQPMNMGLAGEIPDASASDDGAQDDA